MERKSLRFLAENPQQNHHTLVDNENQALFLAGCIDEEEGLYYLTKLPMKDGVHSLTDATASLCVQVVLMEQDEAGREGVIVGAFEHQHVVENGMHGHVVGDDFGAMSREKIALLVSFAKTYPLIVSQNMDERLLAALKEATVAQEGESVQAALPVEAPKMQPKPTLFDLKKSDLNFYDLHQHRGENLLLVNYVEEVKKGSTFGVHYAKVEESGEVLLQGSGFVLTVAMPRSPGVLEGAITEVRQSVPVLNEGREIRDIPADVPLEKLEPLALFFGTFNVAAVHAALPMPVQACFANMMEQRAMEAAFKVN